MEKKVKMSGRGPEKMPQSSSDVRDHLGERSWRGVRGELLEEGDTPSILAGESEDEPTLLRLPSKKSGDRLVERHRYRAL